MSIRIIQERLASFQVQSLQEEEYALKEITQELCLYALYQSGFFRRAAFQGGTCLRILHGLNRFSEDLDFALVQPDPDFVLTPHVHAVRDALRVYGYDIAISETAEADKAMKSAFLKDDSLHRVLNLNFRKSSGHTRSLKIKLEVDTRPPVGAQCQIKMHDFPLHFAVSAHDLPSLFAGKSHALLCRGFVKGRDWFDFLWYASRRVPLNFDFLRAALHQVGPWQGQDLRIDHAWYLSAMGQRIQSLDWEKAAADVRRFLRPADVQSLEHWQPELFIGALQKLPLS